MGRRSGSVGDFHAQARTCYNVQAPGASGHKLDKLNVGLISLAGGRGPCRRDEVQYCPCLYDLDFIARTAFLLRFREPLGPGFDVRFELE